jgi:DNA-binding MarR family transcriptional regulator
LRLLKSFFSVQWTVIDTSTASRALKRLEEQGYVTRSWDRADTRSRRLGLSLEGHRLFAEAWPIVAGLHQHVFGHLPVEEQEHMGELLQGALFRLGKSAWSDVG